MSENTISTIDEFREAYPVGRDFADGKYGWRRVSGALNLKACRFSLRAEAEVDRDAHFAERGEISR